MSKDNSYLAQLKGQVVKGNQVFIAETATVIGEVTLKDKVSVWYGAVIRGDSDKIEIGEGTNIQDHCIVHVDEGVHASIGEYCVVGHRAIVHGCKIGNNCLIGMGAIIMNKAVIEDNCVIGANTLITENTHIPAGSLVVGSPGKVIRQLNEAQIARIKRGAEHYIAEAKKYLQVESDT